VRRDGHIGFKILSDVNVVLIKKMEKKRKCAYEYIFIRNLKENGE